MSYLTAWKICDASAGGVIDHAELKKCLPKIGFKKKCAVKAALKYAKKHE
jgi:hypothetical protein